MVPRPPPAARVLVHAGDYLASSGEAELSDTEAKDASQLGAGISLGQKCGQSKSQVAGKLPRSQSGLARCPSPRSEDLGDGDEVGELKMRQRGSAGQGFSLKRSDTGMLSHQSGRNRAESGSEQDAAEPARICLRRSSSLDSKLSKASTPLWARPVLRRQSTVQSKQSCESSTPSYLCLSELKEERSVKVTYDVPWCDSYDFAEKVGEGGFGQVWKCVHRKTGASYAIKRIASKEKKDVQRVLRELKAFERFCNAYIVTLREVFLDQEWLYMVMDLCTGGDLVQYLENFQDDTERLLRKAEFPDEVVGLPTGMIGFLLWQMLAGIAYMHHHRFCHRDIKLQNYVIKEPSDNPRLQLVDFGMATRFQKGKPLMSVMGTMKYMAPEVIAGSYTEKCDMWSIGVVVYILCTERSPWGPRKTTQQMCQCITEGLRERWPLCDKPKVLRNLVDALMSRDFDARPSAKQLLSQSRWVQSYSKSPHGGAMLTAGHSRRHFAGQNCCTLS